MYKQIGLYMLLCAVLMLLQIFIFDRLMLSVAIIPLVYITLVVILPLQTPQIEMILWGAVIGVLFDIAMGTAGINTIATLATCYTRRMVLDAVMSKDHMAQGGVPMPYRIGWPRFLRYAAVVTLIQSSLFVLLESLNFQAMEYLLIRIAMSSAITLVFIAAISRCVESFMISSSRH